MDDYRLFTNSPVEGYQQLTTLANALFKNHGLTLQQEKTSIISVDDFLENYCRTGESEELQSLTVMFNEILEEIGIEDPYGYIEYDDLDPQSQALIDSINLADLLQKELENDEIDPQLVRFVLRRLGQLDNPAGVDTVLGNIEKVFTVFPQVIQYFARLRSLDNEERRVVGERVLSLMDNSYLSQLDFHRCWLLSLFSEGTEWGNSERLISLYSDAQDNFSKRKLTLSIRKIQSRLLV